MIEPLPFRVDLPSSFKSAGKCLPSHMQGSLNPGKLSIKINHPRWLRAILIVGGLYHVLQCPASLASGLSVQSHTRTLRHLEAYAQMSMFMIVPKIPKSYCSNQTVIIQLSLVDMVAGALKTEVSRANEIYHVLK